MDSRAKRYWSPDKEGPLFNLKAVICQTGLKPDTLRAWERRYGLPSPSRSQGRQRLYSQHDISVIQWLLARQREGLSISRAVKLWREAEAEGPSPQHDALPPVSSSAAATHAEAKMLLQLREQWLRSCQAYDEPRAEQVLSQAFALSPPEAVCLHILQAAMARIGELWYEGRVSVQQERFAAELALRRLESLVMAAPPPSRPGRILTACPPDEAHVFGLLMFVLLMRRRGWAVVHLGANVPGESLETTLAVVKPRLVVFAAQRLHTAATLADMAGVLKQRGEAVAYAGRIFALQPELRSRIAGRFLGESVEAAVGMAETLVHAPYASPVVEPVASAYVRARDHFFDRLGAIEAHLSQSLESAGIEPRLLAAANRGLAEGIGAALALGSMAYLDSDLRWVEGLVAHHDLPAGVLACYLRAYNLAAASQLDERGEPILAWLGTQRVGGWQSEGI